MISKNRKYFIFEKMFDFFNKQNNNIFLFVHSNNTSILESNFISFYCIENKIHILNIKANLYKKIFKNKFFLNNFSGPTKIFAFENFISFLFFFKNEYIMKNYIPLTIFWNNSFFIYSFFYKNILIIYNNNVKFLESHHFGINKSVYCINIFFFNFLKILNIIFFLKKDLNNDKLVKSNYIYKQINILDVVLIEKNKILLVINYFNYSNINYSYENNLLFKKKFNKLIVNYGNINYYK